MPYHFSLMATQGILSLRYYGSVNAQERLQALERVLRTCRDRSITKLLVDFTDQESPTIAMDVMTLCSTLSGAKLPGRIHIAFVCPTGMAAEPASQPASRKQILESKVFPTPDAGCLWLSEC